MGLHLVYWLSVVDAGLLNTYLYCALIIFSTSMLPTALLNTCDAKYSNHDGQVMSDVLRVLLTALAGKALTNTGVRPLNNPLGPLSLIISAKTLLNPLGYVPSGAKNRYNVDHFIFTLFKIMIS